MDEFESRLAAVLATTEELITLLSAENAALAEHRPNFVAEAVDRKISLSRTFERQMQQIAPLRDALAALPADRKVRIVALSERFRAVSAANQAAIDGARRAAERVVGHMMNALRNQSAPKAAAYSRPNLAPRRTPSSRISVSLDQRF